MAEFLEAVNRLIAPWPCISLINEESGLHLSSTLILVRIMSRKFHGLCAKSPDDSVKGNIADKGETVEKTVGERNCMLFF